MLKQFERKRLLEDKKISDERRKNNPAFLAKWEAELAEIIKQDEVNEGGQKDKEHREYLRDRLEYSIELYKDQLDHLYTDEEFAGDWLELNAKYPGNP